MAYRKLLQYTVFGGVTISSFFIGVEYGKQYPAKSFPALPRLPGLPVFGSVSAATPYHPIESEAHANKIASIMKYGFPGMDQIRSYDDFVLSYDRRNRVAHWVFEKINQQSIQKNVKVDRNLCSFKPDDSIHPYFRADNTDFKRAPYDRGHLAAAGNHKYNQQCLDQTFLLSNMAPQVGPGFNRDSWNRLEKYVRRLTKTYINVYCCTGPLYLPKKDETGRKFVTYEVIGRNNVAVPTHFFKVVVGELENGQLELESYVMPNEVIDNETPLKDFMVPPDIIERAAGLLFFDNVNTENIIKINGKPKTLR